MARTMTRWEPFAELAEMRSRFDKLLADFTDGERGWTPAVDVVKDGGHLVVRAEVPGVKPEEIDIKAENGTLTISGQHEETSEQKDKEFVRRERRFGSFTRTLMLPDGVEAKKIKATMDAGVLEVTIPLPQEAAAESVTITPTAR